MKDQFIRRRRQGYSAGLGSGQLLSGQLLSGQRGFFRAAVVLTVLFSIAQFAAFDNGLFGNFGGNQRDSGAAEGLESAGALLAASSFDLLKMTVGGEVPESGGSLAFCTPMIESMRSAAEWLADFKTDQIATPAVRVDFDRLPFYDHQIQPGETLGQLWQRYGGSQADVKGVAAALASSGVEYRNLFKTGELLGVALGDGGAEGLRKQLGPDRSILVERDATGSFHSRIERESLTKRERSISGTVRSSFLEAAYREGLSPQVADTVVDLFAGRVDFRRQLQPGDRFSVILEEMITPWGEVASANHISGASLEVAGKVLYAVRYQGKGSKAHFYDGSGDALGDYFLRYPLTFSRISSVFSHGRMHPVLKVNRPHRGVDFSATTGTPVRTVGDGVVTFAGWMNGGGNTVKIKHSDRYSTVYMHLSKIDRSTKKGGHVSRGQTIGAVGMTGLATGPHLHFELHDSGRHIDPMKVDLPRLAAGSEQIPAALLAEIKKLLDQERSSMRVASSSGRGGIAG